MDRKTLLLASEKAAAFFEDQLDDLGQLKAQGVCGDLAAQYKLPTLLLLTGRAHLAHRVCCLPVCIPVDLSCWSAEGRQVLLFFCTWQCITASTSYLLCSCCLGWPTKLTGYDVYLCACLLICLVGQLKADRCVFVCDLAVQYKLPTLADWEGPPSSQVCCLPQYLSACLSVCLVGQP